MIFAAGLGTRFKPWTDHHPKALALINGKSLLQRNIEYLQQYGITEVVVNVHHRADQLRESIQLNHGWGSQITISDESAEVLETGGGLLNARNLLEGKEPFLTLNADILTDLPLNELLAFHQKHQPLITVSVSNRTTSRYLLFNSENRLCGWKNQATGEEKISIPNQQIHPMAYSCAVVFEPEIFSHIRFQGKFSLTEVYLDLAASHSILGWEHAGNRWIDVGKPERVAQAELLFP